LNIQEKIPLAPLTTFKVGGPARWYARAETEFEVAAAVDHARKHSLPLFVLGGGSNLVVSDGGWRGLVLHVAIKGIAQRDEFFDVGAGEDWDGFVAHAVAKNYAGIECMSGIPGTLGGTPVQNVGAYGQEVRDCIAGVRALDLQRGEVVDISADECRFGYRKSRFNSDEPGRFIVLRVTYRLKPGGEPSLAYADLQKYFAERNISAPTLQAVRGAVREIRRSKAMLIVEGDPDCCSAGSFFKNPQVTPYLYKQVLDKADGKNVPNWPGANDLIKLSAAWLIEQSGLHKGLSRGPVGISSKHTLAIVNRGGAKAADIILLKDEIQKKVLGEFGIELTPEPVMVGF
jgi:UDP-N-acetylmuramate dehydrogenase